MEVSFWAPATASSFFKAENLYYHFPLLYHLHSSLPSGMVPKERILWVLLLLYEIYDEEWGSILSGGHFFLWCYASEHFNNGGAQNRSLPVPTLLLHFPCCFPKGRVLLAKRNEDFPASVHISKNFYVLTQQSLKQNQDLHVIS